MAAASASATESTRKPVVLVVEDEVLVRMDIGEQLRNGGYTVIEAGSAAEAVAVLSAGAAVDAVFTDIYMPGDMNGLGLAAWIAEHLPGTPVLLTSGAGLPAISVALFVSKPYTYREVETQLETLLLRG